MCGLLIIGGWQLVQVLAGLLHLSIECQQIGVANLRRNVTRSAFNHLIGFNGFVVTLGFLVNLSQVKIYCALVLVSQIERFPET